MQDFSLHTTDNLFSDDIRKLIFRLILSEEKFSQAEISRQLGLSRATVSLMVNELKAKGLVVEKKIGESSNKGGRKPFILGINQERFHIIGIWLEGLDIDVYLLNLEGKVLQHLQYSLKSQTSGSMEKPLIDVIVTSIRKMQSHLSSLRPEGHILATSIVMGARINPFSGEILYARGWNLKNFPLGKTVSQQTGFPVYIEDYPAAYALKEYWFGSAKGNRNFLFLTVLPFLRAILVLDGRIYYGAHFLAGQIGGSLGKIGGKTQEYLCNLIDHDIFNLPCMRPKNHDSGARKKKNMHLIQDVDNFIGRLKKNNNLASKIQQLSSIIGQIVVNTIFYYDPSLIIFDGISEKYQSIFVKNIQKELKRFLFPGLPEPVSLCFHRKTEKDRILGILCMTFDRLLKIENQYFFKKGHLQQGGKK